MHGLVISGGGAFGACGAGTIAALDKPYQIISGVSTGSLMAPLVALRAFERLKEAYTSVTQQDIFSVNPFTRRGRIHVLNALWRIIRRKKSLGETKTLRKTIRRFFSETDYLALQASGREVVIACQETSRIPAEIHYFSTLDTTYADFLDWMWASANVPLVTSIVYKDGGEWVDAGLTEMLSLQYLLRRGCTEVDVILHHTRPVPVQKDPVRDIFNAAARYFDIQRRTIENDDLAIGLLSAELLQARVNVYYLPRKLAGNSLIFDKTLMREWYDLGYRTAFDESRIDRFDFSGLE
jgi:NTE family protein